jgi:hypothetical protein
LLADDGADDILEQVFRRDEIVNIKTERRRMEARIGLFEMKFRRAVHDASISK